METISIVASVSGCITAIVGALLLVSKPLRQLTKMINDLMEGQKCILRSEMLRIYYKNREARTIRQYEYENFIHEYQAYKSLKGNSFIDKIFEEVKEWEVLS